MATFEWTEVNVGELITLYEERPCLYNTKSKDYFNRNYRSKTLEEIEANFEQQVKQVNMPKCI